MLMNTDEVCALYAERFGVSRRTVVERWMREPDFPKPEVQISRASRAWKREDIEGWRQRSREAIEAASSL